MAIPRRRALPRRFVGVVLPTLAVFVLLAVTADVILAVRGSQSSLDPFAEPPSADGHRRVLLLGDSLMSDASPQIGELLRSKGIEPRFAGAPGTGPLTPQGFWRDELRRALQEFNADVVVIEACCNYDATNPYRVYGGTVVEPDSPEMYQQWDLSMRELVTVGATRGAQVFVVAIPDVEPNSAFQWLQPRITRLNQIYAGLGVPMVDWPAALARGARSGAAPRQGPSPAPPRASDGLHLSDAGDALVADATWSAIEPAFTAAAPTNPGR